ncbi:hypothetical protein WN944_016034 [Citrus x changshan-huyou]|uniref:Uncharacterized protein n=1 Tax=Citrus x changshan-huyou TaxID=2935761 RepID=A0AAP0MF19_9ROSI
MVALAVRESGSGVEAYGWAKLKTPCENDVCSGRNAEDEKDLDYFGSGGFECRIRDRRIIPDGYHWEVAEEDFDGYHWEVDEEDFDGYHWEVDEEDFDGYHWEVDEEDFGMR